MRLVERRAHLSNLVPHKSGRMDRVTLMRSLARPLCQRGPPTLPFILSRRTFGSGPYAERTWRFGRGMENFQAVLSFEPVGPFQMNQYLLGCPDTGKAAMIDTGDSVALQEEAKKLGLEVTMFLQTHAHIDHILGLAKVKAQEKYRKTPIYLHPLDLPWYQASEKQSQIFGLPLEQPPDPDVELQDGQKLFVGNIELEVIHTPGHCPGHVCFYCEAHGFLIAGDLIFEGSIGRTDFPMCDQAKMKKSLKRIMQLPDETQVFPGHMSPTTIGRERKHNPFLAL